MQYIKDNSRIFLVGVAILLMIVFAGKTYSQNKNPSVFKVDILCASADDLEKVIGGEFQEKAMLTMISSREIDGKEIKMSTVLFANAKTQTWTLAEKWGEDHYCILGMGINIKPYQDLRNQI